jgi:hypothetical protein
VRLVDFTLPFASTPKGRKRGAGVEHPTKANAVKLTEVVVTCAQADPHLGQGHKVRRRFERGNVAGVEHVSGYGVSEFRGPEQGEVGERLGQGLDGCGVEDDGAPVESDAEVAHVHIGLGKHHVLVQEGDLGDRRHPGLASALDPADGLAGGRKVRTGGERIRKRKRETRTTFRYVCTAATLVNGSGALPPWKTV